MALRIRFSSHVHTYNSNRYGWQDDVAKNTRNLNRLTSEQMIKYISKCKTIVVNNIEFFTLLSKKADKKIRDIVLSYLLNVLFLGVVTNMYRVGHFTVEKLSCQC